MNTPTIDMLLLTDVEMQAARKQVEKMAYFKWKNAGSPENNSLTFWNTAELEWIEYFYVPNRNCRGRPRCDTPTLSDSGGAELLRC